MSKIEYWQQHIKAWQYGGLSQIAYCVWQDIRVHNLTYWRKRKQADIKGRDRG